MSNAFSSLPTAQNVIPLSKAIEMTKRYRDNRPNMLNDPYPLNTLTLSETFGRSGFDSLLARQECVGLRIYYGMDEELRMHAIVVGVDVEGADLITLDSSQNSNLPNGEGDVLNDSLRCPPVCPPPSPLNE